jgi:hypothetical protein
LEPEQCCLSGVLFVAVIVVVVAVAAGYRHFFCCQRLPPLLLLLLPLALLHRDPLLFVVIVVDTGHSHVGCAHLYIPPPPPSHVFLICFLGDPAACAARSVVCRVAVAVDSLVDLDYYRAL